ncbi:MAG: antibiotic biosynthesis monooxygenase [Mesorhizobium sp.]|nr:MAG: antibiotic biosynthesis monooxygenase [Mesorhizobium sp.]TJW32231.1 MAG: antibiotic biosynthesis monooxygenase [Mesorhizobium sp.]
MSGHVSWVIEVAVKPGELDNFRGLIKEMIESTRSESGTLMYEWSISEDGSVVHGYERFTDSEAAVAHLSAFAEKFAKRFLAAVDPTRLSVYGTPSDDARGTLAALGPAYLAALGGFSR